MQIGFCSSNTSFLDVKQQKIWIGITGALHTQNVLLIYAIFYKMMTDELLSIINDIDTWLPIFLILDRILINNDAQTPESQH